MRFVLMPGMDGTGRLFDRLEQALGQPCTRVAYDRDRMLSYDQLLPELPDGDGLIVIWSHAVLGPVGLLMGCYGNAPLLQDCLWGAIGTAAAGAVLLGVGAVLAALRPAASWACLRDEPRRLHRVLRFVAAWILIAGMAGVTWSMGGEDPTCC